MPTDTQENPADEIWAILRENGRQLAELKKVTMERGRQIDKLREESQETARRFQETDRQFQETALRFQETGRQFKELAHRFQETDRQFQETAHRFQETDRQFQEMRAEIRQSSLETDARINKVIGQFGNQWGFFVECLVKPSALRLFQERGINIVNTHQRVDSHRNGTVMELDLLLINSDELVIVEVKSRVNQQDVEDLLADLKQFQTFFPVYQTYRVYGAIAGLHIPNNVSRQAYRQGLFVLSLTDEGLVQIKNDQKFKPKNFAVLP